MTESEKKLPEVGDTVGYRRVIAVADSGYYVARLKANGQINYDSTEFVRV